MEIKNEFLYDQMAREALQKLSKTDFDGETAYNIRRICYQYDKNFKHLQKDFIDIVKAHAKLDEKGILIEPKGPGSFELKEDKISEYNKAVEGLMLKTVELEKCKKLNFKKLNESYNFKVSSADLTALEPIFDELDLE